MRTRLMIASATAAALMAGAALAQPTGASGSNLNQNRSGDTAVNPPAANNQLPAGVATGNAATNPGASGQAGSGDVTAPSGSANGAINSSSSLSSSGSGSADAASVAPAAGAPTQRASTASAGVDVVSNGPVPDTRENRAKYGRPLSNAGRMTKAAGN